MQINNVVIGGNLTRDPELRYIPSGEAVVSFTIAINRKYKTSQDELKEDVSFIPVVVWGKQAENCNQYLKKGSQCVVIGRLKQERWEKDGEKKSIIRIVATNVQFVGTGKERPLLPHERIEEI